MPASWPGWPGKIGSLSVESFEDGVMIEELVGGWTFNLPWCRSGRVSYSGISRRQVIGRYEAHWGVETRRRMQEELEAPDSPSSQRSYLTSMKRVSTCVFLMANQGDYRHQSQPGMRASVLEIKR